MHHILSGCNSNLVAVKIFSLRATPLCWGQPSGVHPGRYRNSVTRSKCTLDLHPCTCVFFCRRSAGVDTASRLLSTNFEKLRRANSERPSSPSSTASSSALRSLTRECASATNSSVTPPSPSTPPLPQTSIFPILFSVTQCPPIPLKNIP